MKTNLFNFFYAVNLIACGAKPQSQPDIIFENASPNNTFVFNAENSQNSLCEYDSCHLVLEPGNKQWIAFSDNKGVETITYDICNSTGKDAVIYGSKMPRCAEYSGAKINVTSTINNVTAIPASNNIDDINVKKVKENDTESDASYSVYQIRVSLLPDTQNVGVSSSQTSVQKTGVSGVNLFLIVGCVTAVTSLIMLILCKYCPSRYSRREPLLGEDVIYQRKGFDGSEHHYVSLKDLMFKKQTPRGSVEIEATSMAFNL